MTNDEYQEMIPAWCELKTFDEHSDMLGLCWGITHGHVTREGFDYCHDCIFRTKNKKREGQDAKI